MSAIISLPVFQTRVRSPLSQTVLALGLQMVVPVPSIPRGPGLTPPALQDLARPASTCPAWTAESDQAGADFGYSVSTAGDVNGDGYGDVLVGAYRFDNGEMDEGRAYLYLGSATGLSTSAAWTAEGDQMSAHFGYAVAMAGDVDGDGYGDVLVGAYSFDNGQRDEGRAYAYLGSAGGLSTSPAWTAESNRVDADFGLSVATAGDVNGDGYSDAIIGALFYDSGQSNEGRAYLYLGSPAGLSTSAAWTAESDQASARFGVSVASAGDVNGDGFGDVLVAADEFDNGQSNEGRAYLYLGSAGGLSTSPAWTVESNQALAYLGAVAAAGDVNGDGFGDVVVGAPYLDNGQTDEGRAYAYLGFPVGLSRSAVFAGDGINADTIAPVNALIGSSWSASLAIGHPHGAGGALSLKVRSATANGPNFPSPIGGRLTEFLVAGSFLATIAGSHDGATGDIPSRSIPNRVSLVGVSWAAQYTVAGGGFADLSQAVYGMVDCP